MNNQPFPPGSLVAAYFRDSGGDTQELSIPQQESAFRTWCTKNGLIPGAVFRDVARPGSSVVGRSGFHDMIHHFRSGLAKEAGLVIWSYSRFARDFDTAQFYRADLRMRGFVFYSLNDDIPEGSSGRIFEALIDWKNENFLADLSRDTRRGLHDLVRTYGAVPGIPPRGFKREPMLLGKRRNGQDRIAHRWVPDPDVIPKVRHAFALRAAGKTLAEIQAETHLYLSINCYRTFFNNRLYTGVLEFGDQVIENYCEPVIDQQTWDAVQAISQRFARNKNLGGDNPHHSRRIHSSYLLSGLVYCARCGSPLFGASAAQRNRDDGSRSTYERYACARAYRRRDCDQGQFPQGILDNAVLDTLREYVLQPEVLIAHQQQIEAARAGQLANIGEQQKILRKNLQGLKRRISHLADAIAESGHSRSLLEKLSGLETEETGLLAQLAELDRQAGSAAPAMSADQLGSLVQNLQDILDGTDLAAKQSLLRGFIQKITVDRDGSKIVGVIHYFFPPPADKSPPDDLTSMPGSPLGALHHRPCFSIEFTAQLRAYVKKRS